MVDLLADLLDVPSADRPDDAALTDGGTTLTWREYRDRAAGVAALLAARGVGDGDRVAVHLQKSVWSFVAVHGVLRAGAVMVPLDPLAPPEHVERVVSAAGVDTVVSDGRRSIVERFETAGLTVIGLDDVRAAEPARVESTITPDDPAYIIFTSGSTGEPKGIVHTHRSALAFARLAASTYDLHTTDRLANVAGLHFDQSTFELYAAPLVGAAVVVVPDAVLRFPASTTDLIARERATVWYSVPYVLRQLLTRGALDERDLTALRWVLFGGESFPPGELGALMRALPGARFSNVYGPAEVNQCTYHHLDAPPSGDDAVPIGEAWGETHLLVCAEDGSIVERGTVGELYVASTTMMAGYWGRPDLTTASIVERSDAEGVVRRFYRTGDLVRNVDGQLVFLGRVDHQVKIRGQRVEVEPVEQVLLDQPGVAEAAVVVDRQYADGPQLVGVVVVAPGDRIDGSALTRTLARSFPAAAVPGELLVVDGPPLPRTGTAKIDRAGVRDALDEYRHDTGDRS